MHFFKCKFFVLSITTAISVTVHASDYEDGWNNAVEKCQNEPTACEITFSCPNIDTHALFSPSDGILTIPAVDVLDPLKSITTYQVEMSIVPGKELVFSVNSAEPIQPEVSSSNRYTDNGDGTITDNHSRVIWLKNADCFGEQEWETAIQNAANLATGQCGLSDGSISGMWRLPSLKEWKTMVDKEDKQSFSDTADTGKWIEGDIFTGVQLDYYWSTIPFSGSTTRAWSINLNHGRVTYYDVKTATNYVWPVRSGY